jgi:DNA-binding MarR family transcriptional regulator
MVERLVQQGLAVRVEPPGDRRVRQVHLTERGRRVVEESIAIRQRWVGSLAASLSGDQQAIVVDAMRLLTAGAAAQEVAAAP